MSLDAVNKVSPEDRKTIENIARQSQKKARLVIRRANEDARRTLVRKGVSVVETPQAMIDELTAIGGDVQRELVGKLFTKEELQMVLDHRAAYRAKQR